jgi:hypothetical protein
MKQNKTNCLPSYIDKDVKGKRVKRWWKEPGKKWKEKLNWISCRRRFGNRYLPEDFRPLPAAYQHGDETSNLENTSYKTFTYTKNFVVVQIYQFLLIYTSVGRFSGSSGNHGFWFASKMGLNSGFIFMTSLNLMFLKISTIASTLTVFETDGSL